jgi:hypothetical protein
MKRLYRPLPVEVEVGAGERPRAIGAKPVASVREEWFVEDGWWTAGRQISRRYFELVLEDGSDVVVFQDPSGRWFRQRA